MGDVSDVPYCITRTIDKFSDIGRRYYHNISMPDFDVVAVRPRIPVRYDFHDAEVVPLKTAGDANKLLNRSNLTDKEEFYHLRRTTRSKVNTFLSNLLAVVLMTASIVNMNRIVRALKEDATLTDKDRAMFRSGFVLSFIVVVFLACYLAVAWFEVYRSRLSFREIRAHGFKYLDLTGGAWWSRVLVGVFVVIVVCIATAETFNIFFADNQAIMLLLLPIVACLLLLVRAFSTTPPQPTTATPQPTTSKTKQATQQSKTKQAPQQSETMKTVRQIDQVLNS